MRRHKFMLTLWHFLAVATFATAFAFLLVTIFWTLQAGGKPVVEFPKGVTISSTNPDGIIHAGDTVDIYAPYCKNKHTSATNITRWFQDRIVIYLPALTNNVAVGCADYHTKLELPRILAPDEYTYNLKFDYQLNPTTSKTYTFTSNQFTVVAKEK